jgi:phosphoribosyl-ATP pyrophosphohydrolase
MSTIDLEVLADLVNRIAERRTSSAETSYTARLFHEGTEKCAKKLGEEAVELALAAVLANRTRVRAEAADVLYHLLVLLEISNVSLAEVVGELSERMRMGGLDEKASRRKS